MPADREEDATVTQPAEVPETVADEMQTATQRLRDMAWKLNAVTQTPMIPDPAATDQDTPTLS